MGDFMRSRGIFQNGIPLTRGQVNPGRPCLAPPGVSKSENSLVFIGRERFWRSGWDRLAVDWPSGAVKKLSKSEKSLVFVGRMRF